MLNTHTKAVIAQSKLIEYAVQQGWYVYVPFAEGGRSDLVLEINRELWRVQVKFSSEEGSQGTLAVKVATVQPRKNSHQRTKYQVGDFDLFVVYSALTGKLYVFAVDEVAQKSQIILRLMPSKNGQAQGVHWARDFEYNFERAISILKQRKQNCSRGT